MIIYIQRMDYNFMDNNSKKDTQTLEKKPNMQLSLQMLGIKPFMHMFILFNI